MRFILFLLLVFWSFAGLKAQDPVKEKSQENRIDTLAPSTGYVNRGKIAGSKAVKRSLILPGLGQVYNYGLIVDDIKTGRLQTKGFGKKLAMIRIYIPFVL